MPYRNRLLSRLVGKFTEIQGINSTLSWNAESYGKIFRYLIINLCQFLSFNEAKRQIDTTHRMSTIYIADIHFIILSVQHR